MANYADYLAHFNFTPEFKRTKANANADYCSRFPLPMTSDRIHKVDSQKKVTDEDSDAMDQFILCQIEQLPVRAEVIARETKKDPHLGKILQLLTSGQDISRLGYKAPEKNYSFAAGCLIFEHRVVIPQSLRQAIINELHTAHIGIVKMKGIARSFVYWPGIDTDIENIAKSCTECAKHAHAPAKFRSHHWEYPKGPWERIHIDYAGPVAGTMLLIIVDAFSKWVEVKPTNSTTSQATIAILDELFASYGSPIIISSDNGPQFKSQEFSEFLNTSGVKYHKLSAPYHPATNGQAERYVDTVKQALNKMQTTKNTLQSDVNKFLRQYRIAPHSTTGQSPSLLFLGRNLRTCLDLVRPNTVQTRVTEKHLAEFNPTFREFQLGPRVYFLSYNARSDTWIPGTVMARLGDLHYEIISEGKTYKRHVDQMRSFRTSEEQITVPNPIQTAQTQKKGHRIRFYEDNQEQNKTLDSPVPAQLSENQNVMPETLPPMSVNSPPMSIHQRQAQQPQQLRRSTRTRIQTRFFSPS